MNFEDIVSQEPIFDRTLTKIDVSDDLLSLPYSSGTTGLPKGVMITHANYLSQLFLLGQHSATHINPYALKEEDDEDQDVILQYLPCYHAYGFTTLCGYIMAGHTIVIFKQFKGELFLQTIEKYKLSYIEILVFIYEIISEKKVLKPLNFDSN